MELRKERNLRAIFRWRISFRVSDEKSLGFEEVILSWRVLFLGYQYLDERVVQDGNLITSQGPGTAMEFGLKLVELLVGKQKADEMVGPLIFKK